jgi:16S rRNA (cytidine1402-2'-O)-methyltransferase
MPLYLLPNVFDDAQSPVGLLPEGLGSVLQMLQGLIAENERTGRRYLLKLLPQSLCARTMPIVLLNEHSSKADYEEIAKKVIQGETWGLISDAGMPGIADPGSHLVHLLRDRGITSIRVLPGPSSIFLALVSSGLDAQKFSFQGYVPPESEARRKVLKDLERESARTGMTQICIETPYRNSAFFADCLAVFGDTTHLCVACRLTFDDETVTTHTVKKWKQHPPAIRKEPTVFLFRASFNASESKR